MVNVRHILIQPEGKNDDGTYTDEAWAEAEKKANDLLTEWQNGEHTEDSFAFMAAENSQDPGSVENGGLYEDIYPGKMVDEFDAWCFDPARQPGDTGIVKTSYGYHIMYFSSTGEHAYWYVRAEEDYLNELSVSVLQEVAAKFEVTESEQNAAIVDIMRRTDKLPGGSPHMKRLLFFINPNAGHAEIRSSLMEVLAIFCKGGYEPTVHMTTGAARYHAADRRTRDAV